MGLQGIGGYEVLLEVYISNGLPAFDVVGLPDAAVREARERVRAAIKNNGYRFPVSRMTVNLAPADKKKAGTLYDLPMFIGILADDGDIDEPGDDCAFIGELSLSGELRPVYGALPMAIAAARCGVKKLFVPADNAAEAALKCEKPWIKLNAYSSKGYMIIEVTNPTLPGASKPRRIPELPRGVGSHILTEIAEAYDGQYTCCEEDGIFRATLTLKEDNCDASHSDM